MASSRPKTKQDVTARMRDGVVAVALVDGLLEAVTRLASRSPRDVRTREGLEAALLEVRRRFPAPDDTMLRLRVTTATPPEAVKVFDQVHAVLEDAPTVGILRERWPTSGSQRFTGPHYEVSGVESVPLAARESWNIFTSIMVACRRQPRSIKSARALALAAAQALRKPQGRQKQAIRALAAIPRPYALDPDAAAVAFAHAPREGGGVVVVVVETTEAGVWRTSAKTGIRPVAPRPWHRDPVVAAAMTISAKACIARCAPYQLAAAPDQTWTQALLVQHEGGFEVYIQRPTNRIDHVEIVGRGMWTSLGAEEAVRLASTSGQTVGERRQHWLTHEPKSDADQGGAEASLAALAAAGRLTQAEMERFRFRLNGAVRRTTDAAVLSFLAGLPSATAELARLITPITTYDPISNRRYGLGRKNLDAAVRAATHSDPAAMVRAIENKPTRALVLAAALCGPWQVASEAVASGSPPWKALLNFASAMIGRPLSRAAMRSLGEWPLSPWYGLHNVDQHLRDFSDYATLTAVLWAETPCRPAMTTGQLVKLKSGLSQVGFIAPSVAGLGQRTWDDPVTTTAYADALRCERHDVAGSAVLSDGVIDMIRFLDGKLATLQLTRHVCEAVRRTILAPPGRLVAGLERLSDQMHRSITRMTRERHALSEELINEEMRENGGIPYQDVSEDYPNPLTYETVHGGVAIRPLRHPREIEQEASEMANCVSSYREMARVGNLLLYGLRSITGRSTLGLRVQYCDHGIEVSILQHHGAQHTRVDAPPPSGHEMAASWLLSSLEDPDGAIFDRSWRKALSASRQLRIQYAGLRLSEGDLSPIRQRQLARLDLTHLGCLLGANERKLEFDQFRIWAERLVRS